MKRFVLRTLAVLALMTTGIAVVATPAQASYADCNSGQFCTYIDEHGTGSLYYYTGPYNTCIEIGAPYDNAISSVYNRTQYTVNLYLNHGCGIHITPYVGPGSAFSFGGGIDNDVISSIRIGP